MVFQAPVYVNWQLTGSQKIVVAVQKKMDKKLHFKNFWIQMQFSSLCEKK